MSSQSCESFTRIVMVEFNSHVDARDVLEFRKILERLAERAKGLVTMHCGSALACKSEAELDRNAPNVTYAQFASVWEFEDRDSLEGFITDAFHNAMAGKRFSQYVRHRYVINIA